jgi:hypothetical protein
MNQTALPTRRLVLPDDPPKLQALFDEVALGLLEQNAKSAGEVESTETCMYRDPDGLKCAVGMVIADEHYSPTFEGVAALNYKVCDALIASGRITGPNDCRLDLLAQLQEVHDHIQVVNWPGALRRLAEKWSLSPAALPGEPTCTPPA